MPHNPETQLPLPGPLPEVPHVSLMTCPRALLSRGQGPQTQIPDLISQPNACGRSHRHLDAVIGSEAEALIRQLLTSTRPGLCRLRSAMRGYFKQVLLFFCDQHTYIALLWLGVKCSPISSLPAFKMPQQVFNTLFRNFLVFPYPGSLRK